MSIDRNESVVMRRVAGILLLSVFAAGCSSNSSLFGPSAPRASVEPASEDAQNFGDRVMDFFITGKSTKAVGQTAGQDIDCPQVTVREGAATLAINGPGEPSPMTLRYQGSIGRMARECSVANKVMRMKVGMEGRVILGPAGAPGKVDVPLRFAVVREGPVPQTILTKTYRKEVMLEPGMGNIGFVEIDDDLSFPMPASAADLENYVVYIGFDPEVKKPPPRKAPPRKRRTT
jgi:hypothetical protein